MVKLNAPKIDAIEMIIVIKITANCCFVWNDTSCLVKTGRDKFSPEVIFCIPSIFTWRAPTTKVEATKAQITPKASAIPKFAIGLSGLTKLAKNAATVVTTANPNGMLKFEHDFNHASLGLSIFCRKEV